MIDHLTCVQGRALTMPTWWPGSPLGCSTYPALKMCPWCASGPRAAVRLFRCDNGCASRRCLLESIKGSLVSSRKASVGMRPHGYCQNLLQRVHLLVHTFSG